MMKNFNEATELIRDKPEIVLGIMDMVIGEYIGSGSFRDVYGHATNPNWVVKIQRNPGEFSNVIEYEIWSTVAYSEEHKKWFAPIHWMSDNGKVIIQERVRPITDINEVPDKIPHYFTDIKKENFGFIGNQLVAVDYDYSLIRFANAALTTKMRSAKDLKVKE